MADTSLDFIIFLGCHGLIAHIATCLSVCQSFRLITKHLQSSHFAISYFRALQAIQAVLSIALLPLFNKCKFTLLPMKLVGTHKVDNQSTPVALDDRYRDGLLGCSFVYWVVQQVVGRYFVCFLLELAS